MVFHNLCGVTLTGLVELSNKAKMH
jgi:hypothetical protein